MTFADPLVDGTAGEWSESRARTLATQSRLPYLNGGFGTEGTECGLGGRVIKVTTLEDGDDIDGSLRAAIEATGPRTVVFEVSGAIALTRSLPVRNPYLTIAGQTAPPPGVSLYHHKLHIGTHDVCVQHLRVRLGDRLADGTLRSDFSTADALQIRSLDGDPVHNVVVDNVSLSWAIDELLDVSGPGVSDVTIRDVFFAEPLLGTDGHAYCGLLSDYGANPLRVAYVANVYAHCYRRNPRVGEGTNVVVNQWIYNPGRHAIHISGNHDMLDIWTSMVGNTMAFPTDPANQYDGWRSAFALIENVYLYEPRNIRVYLAGNSSPDPYPIYDEWTDATCPAVMVDDAEVWDRTIYPIEPSELEDVLLPNVGAFPKHRDSADARVISDIQNRTGTYLNSQEDLGGYPDVDENYRELTPPSSPQADSDGDGLSDLREWLQSHTDAVE
jgi:hypothetical protein